MIKATWRNGRAFIVAAVAALGTMTSAGAVTNVEEFMVYETAYLDACGSQYAEGVCRCSMEAIEDRITFYEFAEAVDRTAGDVLRDIRWGAAARSAVNACVLSHR